MKTMKKRYGRVIARCGVAGLLTVVGLAAGCSGAEQRGLVISEVGKDKVEVYVDEATNRQLTLGSGFRLSVGSSTGTSNAVGLGAFGGSLPGGAFLMVWEESGYTGPPVAESFSGGQAGAVPGIKVPAGFFGDIDDEPSEVRLHGSRNRVSGLLVIFPLVTTDRVDDVVRFGTPIANRPQTGGSFRSDGALANPTGSLSLQDSPPDAPGDPASAPREEGGDDGDLTLVFDRFLDAEHWREAKAAGEELVAFGEDALSLLRRAAEHHENAKVRRSCYELIVRHSPTEPSALGTIANDGLTDADDSIRYMCAFHLGEHKVFGAFRRLRHVLDDPTNGHLTRLAAAKSLAELGEADGLPLIYEGLGSDDYMPRYLSNLGLEALTGRDLNDFDYDSGEGAFVSGGVEAKTTRRPIEDAERRARRFQTIAAYCRWLKAERPELYKHLEGGF